MPKRIDEIRRRHKDNMEFMRSETWQDIDYLLTALDEARAALWGIKTDKSTASGLRKKALKALNGRKPHNVACLEYKIAELEAEVKRADNRHSFQLNKRLEADRKVAELEADNKRLKEALDPLESFIHFLEINNATIQILEGHIRRLAEAVKPKRECEHKGCHEEATCGTPTKYGYKGLCPKHYNQASEALKKELNKD